jgi:hypothetical protein
MAFLTIEVQGRDAGDYAGLGGQRSPAKPANPGLTNSGHLQDGLVS